ncbi:Lrp/AsnC family transcriptional regulator [Thalassotalea mangrovi]|uniref:Lrp/AsnC family transcriptional regulator n=1 Tax=Thalassotalea mangrovi TaxID=2572245 RepID=A0A4U1B9S4_9GAMM|nr:Lrp/AsnC family transcriptional regulator [Thalassotalea mangrovi]TKB47144.1 Lrp/AsnC family transcriptional regulator [Thalassotalea mangrovi]
MDNKDLHILDALQQNARIAMSELAEQVNLSDTPCLRRVKKLESSGVIKGYRATLDAQALGYSVLVYAQVRLTENSFDKAEEFEQAMRSLPQILECSVVTGSYDYLLKIIAKDLGHYEHFLKLSLGKVSAIDSIESTVVLKQTFSRDTVPVID